MKLKKKTRRKTEKTKEDVSDILAGEDMENTSCLFLSKTLISLL